MIYIILIYWSNWLPMQNWPIMQKIYVEIECSPILKWIVWLKHLLPPLPQAVQCSHLKYPRRYKKYFIIQLSSIFTPPPLKRWSFSTLGSECQECKGVVKRHPRYHLCWVLYTIMHNYAVFNKNWRETYSNAGYWVTLWKGGWRK